MEKKILIICSFFIIIFLTLQVRGDLINVNSCVNLTQAENSSNSFVLTGPISSVTDDHCINLTGVNDIDFYCSNRSSFIEGSYTYAMGYIESSAIVIRHSNNITFRDCNITDWYYSFYLDNLTLMNITNITFRNQEAGTMISGTFADNLTVKNSSFLTLSGTNYIPVYLNRSDYLDLEKNVFDFVTPSNSIYLLSMNNSLINNNTFYQNSYPGTVYFSGGRNNTISNNTFIESDCPNSQGNSIYLAENSVNVLKNNLTDCSRWNSYSTWGIYTSSNTNLIKDNSISSFRHGIFIFNGAQDNYIEKLYVANGYDGIRIDWNTGYDATANNTIRFARIKNNSRGIYIYEGGSPPSIIDNIIQDSNISFSGAQDILTYAQSTPHINNTLINTTTNVISISGAGEQNIIYVKWYLDVQVTYGNESRVSGATVNISDVLGNNITLTTNETGWITRQNITDFFANYTGNYSLNNYTIHAYSNPENSTIINFTETRNTFVNLTLPSAGDSGIINGGTGDNGGGGGGLVSGCEPLCSQWDIFSVTSDYIVCCLGLAKSFVYDMGCFVQTGTCSDCEVAGRNVCIKCGNHICDYCESYCSCPEDCSCESYLDASIELGFESLFEEKEEKNIFDEIFYFITNLLGGET